MWCETVRSIVASKAAHITTTQGNEEWYHGRMAVSEAEALLHQQRAPDGMFMIIQDAALEDTYVLLLCYNSHVRTNCQTTICVRITHVQVFNFNIKHVAYEGLKLDIKSKKRGAVPSFPGLGLLVGNYMKFSQVLPTALTKPCPNRVLFCGMH